MEAASRRVLADITFMVETGDRHAPAAAAARLAGPAQNGVAATQVIQDGIEGIMTGEHDDMKELRENLTEDYRI